MTHPPSPGSRSQIGQNGTYFAPELHVTKIDSCVDLQGQRARVQGEGALHTCFIYWFVVKTPLLGDVE